MARRPGLSVVPPLETLTAGSVSLGAVTAVCGSGADLCVALLPLSHHLLRISIGLHERRRRGRSGLEPSEPQCAERDERAASVTDSVCARVSARATEMCGAGQRSRGLLCALSVALGAAKPGGSHCERASSAPVRSCRHGGVVSGVC